jgi:hypothetical protein
MIFHLTYLNCGPICSMPITFFLPEIHFFPLFHRVSCLQFSWKSDFLDVLHVFVVSTCPVYFEIFNFFPEFCVLFFMMTCEFLMKLFSSNFHGRSGQSIVKRDRTSRVPFLHTFHNYQANLQLDWLNIT